MAKHYISKLVVPCLDEEIYEIEYSLYFDGTYEIKEILYDEEEGCGSEMEGKETNDARQ